MGHGAEHINKQIQSIQKLHLEEFLKGRCYSHPQSTVGVVDRDDRCTVSTYEVKIQERFNIPPSPAENSFLPPASLQHFPHCCEPRSYVTAKRKSSIEPVC